MNKPLLCCVINPVYGCSKCTTAWCDKHWQQRKYRTDRDADMFKRYRGRYVFACCNCKSRLRDVVTQKYL